MNKRSRAVSTMALLPAAGALLPGAISESWSQEWSGKTWVVECVNPHPCSPADEIYAPLLDHASTWLSRLGFKAPLMARYPAHGDRFVAEVDDAQTAAWEVKGLYLMRARKLYLRSDRYFTIGEPGQSMDSLDFQHETAFELTPVHELFHAVQSNYQGLDKLSSQAEKAERDWIWEGTASAVQIAYAQEFRSQEEIVRRTRSFAQPLHRPNNPEQNDGGMRGTWIFWRDVGRQLGSPSDIGYLHDILSAELQAHHGVEGVDLALPLGLYVHLPRFFAELDGDFRYHFEAASRQVSLPAGEPWKVERVELRVNELAGQGVDLAVTSAAAGVVDVSISLEPNDATFHLIVDGRRLTPEDGSDRNRFHDELPAGGSKRYKVIVANVAQEAAATVSRDATLKVELREQAGAWVRIRDELFEITPGICNRNGVAAMPDGGERGITFNIITKEGSTDVAWGGSGVSTWILPQGCEWSSFPPCEPEGAWSAGAGPAPALWRVPCTASFPWSSRFSARSRRPSD